MLTSGDFVYQLQLPTFEQEVSLPRRAKVCCVGEGNYRIEFFYRHGIKRYIVGVATYEECEAIVSDVMSGMCYDKK